jgi:hypothetical protein
VSASPLPPGAWCATHDSKSSSSLPPPHLLGVLAEEGERLLEVPWVHELLRLGARVDGVDLRLERGLLLQQAGLLGGEDVVGHVVPGLVDDADLVWRPPPLRDLGEAVVARLKLLAEPVLGRKVRHEVEDAEERVHLILGHLGLGLLDLGHLLLRSRGDEEGGRWAGEGRRYAGRRRQRRDARGRRVPRSRGGLPLLSGAAVARRGRRGRMGRGTTTDVRASRGVRAPTLNARECVEAAAAARRLGARRAGRCGCERCSGTREEEAEAAGGAARATWKMGK